MFTRSTWALALLVFMAAPAEAQRVALVIGQNSYTGGQSPTIGLPTLANFRNDTRSVAALFAGHGIGVISCDGKERGCFDLNRNALLKVLATLEMRGTRGRREGAYRG